MKEKSLCSQFEMIRTLIGITTKGITEEQADYIPAGFSNNIRWHLGHILVCTENFVLTLPEIGRAIPQEWRQFFLPKTSPKDFTPDTPSFKELREACKQQCYKIQELVVGKLENKLKEPFHFPKTTVTTVEEAFVFCLFHEGLHLGQIQSIQRHLQTK